MKLGDLKQYPLVYLATPYTKYPKGIEHAFRDAAVLSGALLRAGLNVYSPIVNTHPIAKWGGINPLDHSIWLSFDETLMRKADALLVARLESWEESYGIKEEIRAFAAAGKPIFYLDPIQLEIAE